MAENNGAGALPSGMTWEDVGNSIYGSGISDADIDALVPRATAQTPTADIPAERGARRQHNTAYNGLIEQAANEQGIPPQLLWSVIKNESGFDPRVVSPKGARGLGQFMPGTAQQYGVQDPHDPNQAIPGAARYLRHLMDKFDGNPRLVAAAYNAGENRKSLAQGFIPPFKETRDYVERVYKGMWEAPDFAQAAAGQAGPDQSPEGYENIKLPNGEMMAIPAGSDPNVAIEALRKQHPEIFGDVPEPTHTAAFLAGTKEFAGKSLRGLSELAERGGKAIDSETVQGWAAPLRKESEEFMDSARHTYREMTPEEVAKEGKLGWIKKNITLPASESLGIYGPATVGTVLTGGAGGAALGAGTMGLLGTGNIAQSAEAAGKKIDDLDLFIHGGIDAALNYLKIPAMGPLKNLVLNDLSGPGRGAIIKALQTGGREAAEDLITSRTGALAKSMLSVEGANVAGGVGQTLNERIALGLPTTGAEAEEAYKESAIANALGAVPFGLHQAAITRGAQRRNIDRIAEQEQAAGRGAMPPPEMAAPAPETAPEVDVDEDADIAVPQYVQERIAAMEAPAPAPAAAAPVAEPEVAEPTVRAKQPKAAPVEAAAPTPEVAPAPVAPVEDVTQKLQTKQQEATQEQVTKPYYDELGLRTTSAAYKALKNKLNIDDPTHHQAIIQTLDHVLENPYIQKDAEKVTAFRDQLKASQPVPEVAPRAEQIQKTAEPDVSGSAQQGVLQAGESPDVSGKRVRKGRPKAGPTEEVKTQEIAAPEVTAPVTPEAPKPVEPVTPEAPKPVEAVTPEAQALPRIDVGKKGSLADQLAQEHRDIADRHGLTGRIEELFADGSTAGQVTAKLRAEKALDFLPPNEHTNFVVGTRATLGIPSRMDEDGGREFDAWRKEYDKRKGVTPKAKKTKAPPAEAPVEAPKYEVPTRERADMESASAKDIAAEHEQELAHHQALNNQWFETQGKLEIDSRAKARAHFRYQAEKQGLTDNAKAEFVRAQTDAHMADLPHLKERAARLEEEVGKSQEYLTDLEKRHLDATAEKKAAKAKAKSEAEAAPVETPVARNIQTPAESGALWDEMRSEDTPAWADISERDIKSGWHSAVGGGTGLVDPADPKVKKDFEGLAARAKDMAAFRAEQAPKVAALKRAAIKERANEVADRFYSRSEEAKNPHTEESLRSELRKHGISLPYMDISTREREGVDNRVQGFYDPQAKRVVLVHENIDKGDDIRNLLRHEVAVHAKRLGKSDAEFKGILKQVENLKNQGVREVMDAYAAVPDSTKAEHIHEEALARLVEKASKLPIVKRFLSWMRHMGYKLTGSESWLRPDDLRYMADEVLKTAHEEAPTRGGESRQFREMPEEARELQERGLTKTGTSRSEAMRNEAVETASNLLTKPGASFSHLRHGIIDEFAALSHALKDQPTFSAEGKLRADMIASQQRMQNHFIAEALKSGYVRRSDSGTFYIEPSRNSVSKLIERAHNMKGLGKDPARVAADVLRVMVGEHWLKETARIRDAIAKHNEHAAKLEAHAKKQKSYEARAADERAAKALRKKAAELQDRIGTEGLEKIVTPEDIKKANALRRAHPELEQFVQDVRENMRSLVDLHHQVGLIDASTAALWKKNPYVPLYKSLEDLAAEGQGPKGVSGGAKSMPKVHKLLGGTHAVNMFENLQKHSALMTMAAFKNNVRRSAIEQLLPLGGAEKLPHDKRSDRGAVLVREDGKDVFYKVHDPYILSALEMAQPVLNGAWKTMNYPARLLRFGALMNPEYWVKQLLRDPILANFSSRTGIVTPFHSINEFRKIIANNSKEFEILKRHGISGVVDALNDPSLISQGVDPKKVGAFKQGWDKWQHIHEAADAATRVAVFKQALKEANKKGFTGQKAEDFAVMKAREIINFSNRGHSQLVNNWRMVTPFFGAALNGLDVIARNAFGTNLPKEEARVARQLFWTRAAVLSAASAALASFWADDERYQKLNNRTRFNNWVVGFENVDGKERPITIPIPPEVGFFFKGVPEAVALYQMGFPGKEKFLEAGWDMFKDTVLPPTGIIPQAFRPAYEIINNWDSHGGHPIVSAGMQSQLPRQRGRDKASLFGIGVSDMLNKVGFESSPVQTDYFFRQHLSDAYNTFAAVTEALIEPNRFQNKDLSQRMPWLSSFMPNPDNTLSKEDFFDGKISPGQVAGTVRGTRRYGNMAAANYYRELPEFKGSITTARKMEQITDKLTRIDAMIARLQNSHGRIPDSEIEKGIRNYTQMKEKLFKMGAKASRGYEEGVEEEKTRREDDEDED